MKDVGEKPINNYFLIVIGFINYELLGDWKVGFEGIWGGNKNRG